MHLHLPCKSFARVITKHEKHLSACCMLVSEQTAAPCRGAKAFDVRLVGIGIALTQHVTAHYNLQHPLSVRRRPCQVAMRNRHATTAKLTQASARPRAVAPRGKPGCCPDIAPRLLVGRWQPRATFPDDDNIDSTARGATAAAPPMRLLLPRVMMSRRRPPRSLVKPGSFEQTTAVVSSRRCCRWCPRSASAGTLSQPRQYLRARRC